LLTLLHHIIFQHFMATRLIHLVILLHTLYSIHPLY
jgi:hypothetical protein